jgi:hypothetical protein
MKQPELIVLGLAGVAVFLIWKTTKKPVKKSTVYDYRGPSTFEVQGNTAKNGWTYFDDGTALDPQGNAWKGGQIVATPTKATKWI